MTYPLIRSKRKTLSIGVNHSGEVTVRAPLRVSLESIQKFVQKNQAWIDRKVATAKAKQPRAHTYRDGDTFVYLGMNYTLRTGVDSDIKLPRGTKLWLYGNELNTKESDSAKLKTQISKWYRDQARQYLTDRLDYWADIMQLKYSKFAISGAGTRWGSCSRQKGIRLNWKLIISPVEIIDYVIVHELAHLVHFNHSQRFWNLVAKYYPEHKAARKWLNDNGHSLS